MSQGRRVNFTDHQSRTLAERIRAGDRDAFREVYLAFYQPLLEFAYSYVHSADTAEDIIQDVFATWWERRATVKITGELDPYLYGAVRNRALHNLRQHRYRERDDTVSQLSHNATLIGEITESADVRLERLEAEQAIAGAISELPELGRTALTLRIRHNLPYTAIGEILGISDSAAMIHVSRARSTLKLVFERYFHDD